MILFCHPSEVYGCFSNSSKHRVRVFGSLWETSEHAYQSAKFDGRNDIVDQIRRASGPGKAASIGRNPDLSVRHDWNWPVASHLLRPWMREESGDERIIETVKDLTMAEVVFAKFEQHAEARRILLSTKDEYLVDVSPRSPYWGWGYDRQGKNKLGRILMLVRTKLNRERVAYIPGENISQLDLPALHGAGE